MLNKKPLKLIVMINLSYTVFFFYHWKKFPKGFTAMLFSMTLEDRQISFFRSMLNHVLSGDTTYKALIDPVIADAKALVVGSKNYYTIDRDSYHVIVRLTEGGQEILKNIITDNIAHDDYQVINDILTTQRQLNFA